MEQSADDRPLDTYSLEGINKSLRRQLECQFTLISLSSKSSFMRLIGGSPIYTETSVSDSVTQREMKKIIFTGVC